MSDFSAYGGPSEEWVALAAQLPVPPDKPVAELVPSVNAQREKRAQEGLEKDGLASKIKMTDHSITSRDGAKLEARTYRPLSISRADEQPPNGLLPVYIHLHGGGFAFGTLSSEDAICARIAVSAEVLVLNVNYRHTPEAVYPTAWLDAQDALIWLHQNIQELGADAEKVVIGGISAGAQVTASVVLQKHLHGWNDLPPVAGQILMIPCLVTLDCYQPQLDKLKDERLSSYVENEHAPILPKTRIRAFMDMLKIEDPDPKDLALNPGNASIEHVKGLPPTVLGICGLDPLRDEGLLFGKMLVEAGVPAHTSLFRGVPHGYRNFGERLSRASKNWDTVMNDGIRWVLNNPQPAKEFIIHDLK